MPDRVALGMRGQDAAEVFLREKGFAIVARNFRCRQGEVDLLARDGTYLVFVEVKYRRSVRYGLPREAVNAPKQRRIRQCALFYMAREQLADQAVRFDVIEVLEQAGRQTINHLENAF